MPGSASSHTAWPRVSDYVVEPETDIELFNGQIREVLHAGPLHSQQLNQVSYVLGACVAPGHGVDVDLLTRQDAENNFASDLCIRKDGIDPDTDDRYLEELAFEIKSTQDPDEGARGWLHRFLQDRGIAIDAAARARIAACSDLAVLERWAVRAALGANASELFGDD